MFYHFPETDLYKWWPLKPPILFTDPSASNFCRNELATDILTSICLANACTVIILASLIYFVALDSLIITVQGLARQIDVKISTANSFLQKLLGDGTIKRIGGFSGHHLYKSVSGNW